MKNGINKTCKFCGIVIFKQRKYCKSCGTKYRKEYHKEHNKNWKLKNKERLKSYRSLHREESRRYWRDWYKRNGRKRNPNYCEITRKWELRNPEKKKAHYLVRCAIRCGKIKRPNICEYCRKEIIKLEGHHPDYNKPFDITWLCHSCHWQEHHQKPIKRSEK